MVGFHEKSTEWDAKKIEYYLLEHIEFQLKREIASIFYDI